MKVPAFLPLVLRWKPVGEQDARPLANAYCVFDIPDTETAELLRRVMSPVSHLPSAQRTSTAVGLRFLARTDNRGVVMAAPPEATGPRDARNLPSLAPVLWPIGAAARLWWTGSEHILDAVLRHLDQGLPAEGRVELCFGDDMELPDAIDQVLVELDDGPALRSLLIRSRDAVYPRELLRFADDAKTWCVDLHDHALEIALDMALTINELAELPDDEKLSAHQLLLAQVLKILRRGEDAKGKSTDWKGVVNRHNMLGGADYRELASNMEEVLNGCRRAIADAGQVLERVLEAALLELSLHGYPNGSFERDGQPGIVSRNWASKVLLGARALALRDALVQTFYDSKEEGLRERLLKSPTAKQTPQRRRTLRSFWHRTRL